MKTIFESRKTEITYTAGQTEALTKISNFLKTDDSFFLLAGYSGCGKTTIAENIANFTNASILAPTNAALNRLREKIDNEKLSYATIHRALYGGIDTSKVQRGLLPRKTYIIDEASMIDAFILNDLIKQAILKRNKLIIIGDSFQLEPVGKDPFLFKWNLIKPEIFKKENFHELNEVKRYDGDLLTIATSLRTNNKPEIKLPASGDLTIVSKFSKQLSKDIKENSSYVVITSTNATRVDYNKKIREYRYKLDPEELNYIQKNEKIVSVSNSVFYSNGEIFTVSDPRLEYEFEITKLDKNEVEKKYKVLIYDYDNGKKLFFVPDLMEPSLHGAELVEAFENNKFQFPYKLRNLLFEKTFKFLKFNRVYTICTYGYAISCHKAQGQEWNNIYIDASWLMPIWNHARWFYTAITRAKLKVEIKKTAYLKIIE